MDEHLRGGVSRLRGRRYTVHAGTLAKDRGDANNMVVNERASRRLGCAAVAIAFAAGFAVPAAAVDRRVRVVNDSTRDIVRFFAANVDRSQAMENLLGEDILPAGGSLVLNFEDGSGYCRFRFRAVFDDGVTLSRDSVNVCEVGTYRYTD
jgi:hypothetical protein